MKQNNKSHMLFAAYMAGGIRTIQENLQNEISSRNDLDSTWLNIEMDPKKLIKFGKKRISFIPGTIRNSMVTHREISSREKNGIKFNTAYFFQHTICMGLTSFRKRVPYVIAMDGCPMFYAKHKLWYAHPYFDPDSPSAKIKHVLTRHVYHKASHLLPLSNAVKDSLINDYQVPEEKITIVPPGMDIEKYSVPDRTSSERNKKPFNILFIGYDFIRKGGDLLVKLASMPEFQNVQFNFVTKTYEGPKLSNIQIHDNISANSEPMFKLLHEADLFVLPTREDTHSVSALEAMAVGLPVIIVPVGGIPDIVEHGETGFLVAKDSIQELKEKISILKNNLELRLDMGIKSRRRVERKFNIKEIGNTVINIMQSAADQKLKGFSTKKVGSIIVGFIFQVLLPNADLILSF